MCGTMQVEFRYQCAQVDGKRQKTQGGAKHNYLPIFMFPNFCPSYILGLGTPSCQNRTNRSGCHSYCIHHSPELNPTVLWIQPISPLAKSTCCLHGTWLGNPSFHQAAGCLSYMLDMWKPAINFIVEIPDPNSDPKMDPQLFLHARLLAHAVTRIVRLNIVQVHHKAACLHSGDKATASFIKNCKSLGATCQASPFLSKI